MMTLLWLQNSIVPTVGLPDDDFGLIRRDGRELVGIFEEEPLTDTTTITPRTKEAWEYAWVIWTRYALPLYFFPSPYQNA